MDNSQTALSNSQPSFKWQELFHPNIIVSALGYFVDIYDLVLFSIVRKPSLIALGLTQEQVLTKGVHLINLQMIGMLLGGLLWGILGDKKGRISVLFGSILLYSVANILNAFVTNVEYYGFLRLLAGIGLAGELGAAVTLVSESLHPQARGYGTALIAGIGVSGAIAAGLVARYLDWKAAYIIGGLLGLGLLGLRLKMFESPMFSKLQSASPQRGNFWMLWNQWSRARRYLASILIGTPMWFIIGILVTFAPEITKDLGITEDLSAGDAIIWAYGGLVIGDLASGFLSQMIKSRRKVIFAALVGISVTMVFYLNFKQGTPRDYLAIIFVLGLFAGYWAVFITIGAEQFGTNLRATVATTVPNFVRAMLVPMTLLLQRLKLDFGLVTSALIVGCCAILIAGIATLLLEETYGRDLDFLETP